MAKNSQATVGVTLKDVAQSAGVHPGTASRALNPDTRELVNEATARRVLEAAERLGYRPNPMARGLKTRRSYTVGVLIPDLTNPLFPPIVRGIQDRLEESGYTPLIANTDNDVERERIDLERLQARQVDGFITGTARSDHTLLTEISEAGVPIVLINRRADDTRLPAVVADDEAGVRLAVEHLAELGHRRIAHLAGPERLSTGSLRRKGFVAAMRDEGLEPDDRLIVSAEAFTEREGARLCDDLMEWAEDVTAIVAGNDLMALGCYDVLRERGIGCPDDVSVVGFNDMPFAHRFDPPLTTIRIPHYEMGAGAAELLLELLSDSDAASTELLLLEPELVVRGSTGPARPRSS